MNFNYKNGVFRGSLHCTTCGGWGGSWSGAAPVYGCVYFFTFSKVCMLLSIIIRIFTSYMLLDLHSCMLLSLIYYMFLLHVDFLLPLASVF